MRLQKQCIHPPTSQLSSYQLKRQQAVSNTQHTATGVFCEYFDPVRGNYLTEAFLGADRCKAHTNVACVCLLGAMVWPMQTSDQSNGMSRMICYESGVRQTSPTHLTMLDMTMHTKLSDLVPLANLSVFCIK